MYSTYPTNEPFDMRIGYREWRVMNSGLIQLNIFHPIDCILDYHQAIIDLSFIENEMKSNHDHQRIFDYHEISRVLVINWRIFFLPNNVSLNYPNDVKDNGS